MSAQETEETLEEWVSGGRTFALYRRPGETCCRGVRPLRAAPVELTDVRQLNGRKGFVFAPFRCGGEHPLCLLPFDGEVCLSLSGAAEHSECEAPAPVPPAGGGVSAVPTEAYARAFGVFSGALCSGEFRKLVLSRKADVTCPARFSWAAAFAAACRRYVHSYVYLFYMPHVGFWLGATPEILLCGEAGRYRTVSLAGTQYLCDGRLAGPWSEKNIAEQACVTQYIADCLQRQGIGAMAEGTYTATAGELAHLKTDLCFSLSSTDRLGDLLQELYPTPAVCGLPKAEARQFICRHEGYDRSYYAGFLGRLDPDGSTELYVNLRCMQGTGDGLHLYAGGGLLAASVLEDEWMETERKMQTMKYVIDKGAQL